MSYYLSPLLQMTRRTDTHYSNSPPPPHTATLFKMGSFPVIFISFLRNHRETSLVTSRFGSAGNKKKQPRFILFKREARYEKVVSTISGCVAWLFNGLPATIKKMFLHKPPLSTSKSCFQIEMVVVHLQPGQEPI